MPKENELTAVNTVTDDDKVRVVTSAGLSHSIEVGHLKSSLSIDHLSGRVDTLENEVGINDAAHGTMDSRLTSLELAMGEEGDGDTELGFGLIQEVSNIQSRLDQIDPSEITRLGDEVDEIHERLILIDGTSGQLEVLTDRQDDLTQKQTDLESAVDAKLDQSTFQSAVAAGFKVIGKTPASASAAGEPGEVCWNASYFYVCVANNTWKRTPLESW